ncbi:hypothetical protein [Cohnella rhizosphaerae]|uniref:Uncharacterized protein n=1 Tax=Cohnella rhizosphaerae TaxID=1457232 RepID=A0A9X4L0C7_9BACL|nr:hypothetical protein [Cohnella rhizosphaerae]MDG0814220.1 hypothetical protein [Cohnella rhizosphaerae]
MNAWYNSLVEKEDKPIEELETIEAYVDGMLRYTHKQGDRFQMTMIEDILNAVFALESDRRQHLLHVRFEKALLSNRLQKN